MSVDKVSFHELDTVLAERGRKDQPYLEFLREAAMSAGVYVLAAGVEDRQAPHSEDELYYVIRGRARMRVGDAVREVRAGTLVFVAAMTEHRFQDIEEELAVLVLFAPAESG